MIVIFGRAVEDSGERIPKRRYKKGWTDSANDLLLQSRARTIMDLQSGIKAVQRDNDSLNRQLDSLRSMRGLVATPVNRCPDCYRQSVPGT